SGWWRHRTWAARRDPGSCGRPRARRTGRRAQSRMHSSSRTFQGDEVTHSSTVTSVDRYIVISADCHAGADLLDYRPYLEARYQGAFDDWAATFVSPYGDLVQPDADRNWDSTRRMREMEA